MRRAAILLTMFFASGCYLMHERGEAVTDAAADAPQPDAAVVACVSDRDAAVPSPATPPAAGATTFEIAREVLLSGESGGGATRFVHGLHTWVGGPRLVTFDGTLLPEVDSSGRGSYGSGLTFSGVELAMTASNDVYDRLLFFFGEEGQSTRSPVFIRHDGRPPEAAADDIDVAWSPSRGAYVVASMDGPPLGPQITIRVFGADGTALETLGVVAASRVERVRIAATEREAFVILQQQSHILQGLILGGNPVTVLAGPFDVLVNDGLGNATPTLYAYGDDRFLIAGTDGHEVRVSTVDTATCEGRAVQPRRVGATGILDLQAGIAVAPEHGFYVVCFGVGLGPHASDTPGVESIVAQAVGADGTLWGAPFTVATDTDAAGVACGWDGEHVVVVYGYGCFRGCDGGATTAMFLRPTFL